MTPAEYFDACAAHDWYFEFSDSGAVWRRGRDARAKLDALADTTPAHRAIRDAFGAYMFSGEAFGCPAAPLPSRALLVNAGIDAQAVDTAATTCKDSVHPEQLTF